MTSNGSAMDAYPSAYRIRNLPFMLLSGLPLNDEAEPGSAQSGEPAAAIITPFKVTSELPVLSSDVARQIKSAFLEATREGDNWDAPTRRDKGGASRVLLKLIGRDHYLPPRKAAPPAISSLELSPIMRGTGSRASLVLHSPLSPLTPGSPTYPDGIMTPLWVDKHQAHLPCAFITCFSFTSDPNYTSLHDNQLKVVINKIRSAFITCSYKTRVVVVLLCDDKAPLAASEIDDRLSTIRRATTLDPKNSLFFLPAKSSKVEVRAFVDAILATLQPLCIEYYRELSKHARRKRNRGSAPPPTTSSTTDTSRTLPNQGWLVRYEFKLGVLAEFRQEMDVASRHYESAYEGLFAQDVFPAIENWDPRWNETRLLADIIAFRLIRCLLWNNQTTSAVKIWEVHRERMRDLIDRKGKGTVHYGWKAWECRWASIMADLVRDSGLLPCDRAKGSPNKDEDMIIYAAPEKTIPIGERLPAWEHLHHPGYWLLIAAKALYERRSRAHRMPKEDRISPGQSPASAVASRSSTYDTYLCPEPHEEFPLLGYGGVDHSELIVNILDIAIGEFSARGQRRAEERVKLDLAREESRRGNWQDALHVVRPIWQTLSWRKEGWWDLMEEVGWMLHDCALNVGDAGSLLGVEWELSCNVFTRRPEKEFNVTHCLSALKEVRVKPAVVLRAGENLSFVNASFVFQAAEGYVGEVLLAQLVVTSCARERAAPATLREITITFEGSLSAMVLRHDESLRPLTIEKRSHYQEIQLFESVMNDTVSTPKPNSSSKRVLNGEGNLTLAPGQTSLFNITSILREAGELRATTLALAMATDDFDVEFIQKIDENQGPEVWHSRDATGSRRSTTTRSRPHVVNVLPKPPKIRVKLFDQKKQYYTSERVKIELQILNEERDAAEISAEVRLLGRPEDPPKITWSTESDDETIRSTAEDQDRDEAVSSRRIGRLGSAATTRETFSFDVGDNAIDYLAEVQVIYHLLSDVETPISTTLSIDLPVVGPFEANYDFSPRVHNEPWPSIFDLPTNKAISDDDALPSRAGGITSKWCLAAKVVSFATEDLIVEGVELSSRHTTPGITCVIGRPFTSRALPVTLVPSDLEEIGFDIFVERASLEDRKSAALNLSLDIKWRRVGSEPSHVNTISLAVPRLLVPGGEPRALASVRPSETMPGTIHLDYTLENPSTHLLTWSLTMETSDDFAFSGPKLNSLQLMPFSRHVVCYNLLPIVQGKWIQPQLRILDRYYNKVIKVSATEGMKMDRKGILVWINAEE